MGSPADPFHYFVTPAILADVTKPLQIAISAGELSGDEYAGDLARALKRLRPELEIFGMGGRNLRAAGGEILVDCEAHGSIMGFTEVLRGLGRVYKSFKIMRACLAQRKPNLLIVIDYAEFNLRLAQCAKRMGIKVLYFIPPQVWAWRSSRIETMKRSLDAAVVLFPFEREYLEERGFKNAYFFGHPLVERIHSCSDRANERAKVCQELGLEPTAPLFLFLPGSRKNEVQKHLAIMVDGFRLLTRTFPNASAIIVAADSVAPELFSNLNDPNIHVVAGNAIRYMQICDAGVLKSGTSNLQAALCGLPFVMLYRTSLLTEAIVRTVTSRREFSIVNILRPGTVRELCQRQANAANISDELVRLLTDNTYNQAIKRNFETLVESLVPVSRKEAGFKVSASVAELAVEIAGAS